MTPLGSLDDPMQECRLVRSTDLQTLYQRATDATLSQKERVSYHLAVTEMSTHLVDSPLYKLDYGSNDIGATLATATDMMHAFESGVLPHLLKVFTASMTMSVWVKMNDLAEKMFLLVRSTCSNDFPRYNFKGGATSLTMLNSHHLAGNGIYLPCSVAHRRGNGSLHPLFFPRRCRRSRLAYPWEAAPPVDLANVYRPPILEEERSNALAGDNDSLDGESSSEGEYITKADDNDDGPVGLTQNTEKAKKSKKMAFPLNCSHLQFVGLLEDFLCFHAWYKEGLPPIVEATPEDEVNDLQTCIRRMLARIQVYCPRNKGRGWKLQKLHEMAASPCYPPKRVLPCFKL
jgi:hypothetical protein